MTPPSAPAPPCSHPDPTPLPSEGVQQTDASCWSEAGSRLLARINPIKTNNVFK